MKYLLDANAWIGHLRQTSPEVSRKLALHPRSDIVLCSVVLTELLYGVERCPPPKRAGNLALVTRLRKQYAFIPFDDAAAVEAAQIRAHLASVGTPIGPNDLLIAAMVTHNTSEFSRVPNLPVEDWQVP